MISLQNLEISKFFRFQQIDLFCSGHCAAMRAKRCAANQARSEKIGQFPKVSPHKFPKFHLELLTPLLCAKRWRYLPGNALMVAVNRQPAILA
jgi:hypothetical protein